MNKVKESNNKSGIPYQGTLTAKIIRNGKIVKKIKKKNTGTLYLFEQLVNCILGEDVHNNMPKYLDAGTIASELEANVNNFRSSLVLPVDLTGRYKEFVDGTYWSALFNAFIPFSTIINTEEQVGINAFALKPDINSPINEILALVKLDDHIIINQGESLLIEWRMAFTNVKLD